MSNDLGRRLLEITRRVPQQDSVSKLIAKSKGAKRRAEYQLTSAGRRSRKTLKGLEGVYQGKRCVIIGNGPSLKKTDLSLLKDEYTFGLNRIYLNFESMGFATNFLVCVNPHVIGQWSNDFNELNCQKFFAWGARKTIEMKLGDAFLRSCGGPKFCTQIDREGVWEGSTVTYVAMQIAYFLGFTEVILVGVDHSFTTLGPANQLVVSTGEDPNHFHPAYFGAGARWQLPDLGMSELAYRLAEAQFSSAGRTIIDSTVGGKLEVFQKRELSAVLGESRREFGS